MTNKKIELYLNSQKAVLRGKNPYYDTITGKTIVGSLHPRDDDCYTVKAGIFEFSEKEKEIIAQLEQMATQYNTELRIYDVKNFRHAFLAFLKNIDETPAIVIDKKKYKGDIYEEEEEWLDETIKEQKSQISIDPERVRNGLVFIIVGCLLAFLTQILRPSSLCYFSGTFSVLLIGVGCLVALGDILDAIK